MITADIIREADADFKLKTGVDVYAIRTSKELTLHQKLVKLYNLGVRGVGLNLGGYPCKKEN